MQMLEELLRTMNPTHPKDTENEARYIPPFRIDILEYTEDSVRFNIRVEGKQAEGEEGELLEFVVADNALSQIEPT